VAYHPSLPLLASRCGISSHIAAVGFSDDDEEPPVQELCVWGVES